MIESDEQNEINNSKGEHKKKVENLYKIKLITKQENEMTILIKIENSKLNFICYYFKDYFKISFQNSFSLEELKKKSNYFLQFTEIKGIFDEIYDNPKKGEEYLDGNENLLEKIKLIIPLPSKNYPLLEFELNKVKKEKDDLFKEYKQILNIYKNKIKINNFNSKILSMKEREKEFIKFWISPIENLKAELLFSFYNACDSKKKNYSNNSLYYNLNKTCTVRLFHEKCDDKKSILVICKSKNEIFGGYTPLCFKSDDSYGKDNESFLFSLNRNQKYPKNSFDNNESIWCYEKYGPSFHWDLYFRKNKINIVKFENKNYLTYNNWVNNSNCYENEFGIVLDSLEIFQIIKINDEPEENDYDNINEINNINNINNIDNINNINNKTEINTNSSNIQED